MGLGGTRLVCLVRLGKSHLLLGVTDENVNLVKEYTDGDLDDLGPLCTTEDAHAKDGQGTFLQHLSREYRKARKRISGMKLLPVILLTVLLIMPGSKCHGAPSELPVPNISVNIEGQEKGGLGTALGLLGMLTVLTLAPAILILTTSFTRIVMVFSFLRSGLGTQQSPPNQVLVGLALLLTFFIMTPTWKVAYETAIAPYIAGEIESGEAMTRASVPLREFMLRETRDKDLALFAGMNDSPMPSSPEDMSLLQVAPAFCISEMRTAFEIGFMLYLPFLVVDMVVASTLMSMGMLMLPPVLISLPFKLLLFILVDGWGLVTRSLVAGFQ